jgi:hypothetical protein
MSQTESWYIECDVCQDSFRGIGCLEEVEKEARDNGWDADTYEGTATCPKCKKDANTKDGGKK